MTKVFFSETQTDSKIHTPTHSKKNQRESTLSIAENWNKIYEKPEDCEADGEDSETLTPKAKAPIQKKPESPFEIIAKKNNINKELIKEFPKNPNPQPFSEEIDLIRFDGMEKPILEDEDVQCYPGIAQSPLAIPTPLNFSPEIDVEIHLNPMVSPTTVSQIHEIINQLAEDISIATGDGLTEMTIEIKNAGLFNEAKVTITECETAPNEMNIRFENISPMSHELISMQANQELLKHALEQKGYYVHIITAHIEISNEGILAKGFQYPQNSGKEKNPQQQNQKQKQR